jgi:hypothetical protein
VFDERLSPREETTSAGGARALTAGAAEEVAAARSLSLDEVVAGLAGLRGQDVSVMGDGGLLTALGLVERARRSLDVLSCHLAAEVEVRGVTDERHGLRTVSWLAGEAALPRPVARRPVTLGLGLRRLPAVDAAFREGRIGIEQVAVLVRVANRRIEGPLDAAVPALIEDLDRMTFEAWKAEVEAFARLLDEDGPAPDERPSTLSVSPVGAEHALKGRFSGLEGEGLAQAIEAVTDELFRQAVADAKEAPDDLVVPARSELRAKALLELVRRGVAARHRGPGPAPELSLVLHTHPTDPVELTGHGDEAAGRWLWPDGTVRPTGQPCCGGDHELGHDVDVDRSPLPHRLIELRGPRGNRHHVPRDHWVLCDPLVHPVVVDHLGVPLDVGRAARYATPDQRRALAARDGGCTFPGCDAPVAWCDAHHVVPWDDGGPTDLANLALLCRHHHGVTHRRSWTMTATVDQHFTWTTPTGATLHSQRHQQRAGPD